MRIYLIPFQTCNGHLDNGNAMKWQGFNCPERHMVLQTMSREVLTACYTYYSLILKNYDVDNYCLKESRAAVK